MTTRITIRPGPGRIAILPMDSSHEHKVPGTDTKLWIPSSASHEGLIGKVVAVCGKYVADSGVQFDPNYDVGDLVVIGKFTGTRLNVGRETYTILHESDVLASIETEEIEDVPQP
jgi:chaperonin GroES